LAFVESRRERAFRVSHRTWIPILADEAALVELIGSSGSLEAPRECTMRCLRLRAW